MKHGREDAADEPEATIGAAQSAAVAAAVGGAAESTVAAEAAGAATIVPAPAAIAAVEAPVGEHKVGEDLEEEEMRRRKRKIHDEIEELFEENAIKEFDLDCRKGSDFDEDAIDELSEVIGGGIDGMIQHAFSIGNGHGKKHKASTLAKHATYARFLEIVKVNEPYNMH
ncbi:hypothetical protein VPH35_000042 [Triticum aestivum]